MLCRETSMKCPFRDRCGLLGTIYRRQKSAANIFMHGSFRPRRKIQRGTRLPIFANRLMNRHILAVLRFRRPGERQISAGFSLLGQLKFIALRVKIIGVFSEFLFPGARKVKYKYSKFSVPYVKVWLWILSFLCRRQSAARVRPRVTGFWHVRENGCFARADCA